MSKIKVKRFHDFSYGHRVVGHESCCKYLHGHNGRVHFTCEAENGELDSIGRVIDFGEVKSKLCMWIENNWDHRFIAWEEDSLIKFVNDPSFANEDNELRILNKSFVFVPFNPTAENMAQYLVDVIGPQQLKGTGIVLTSVTIEETRKCSVTYEK
jgi:6-pyruvoyltetrahydropterin/6-carboxytetrahydropterin synthase